MADKASTQAKRKRRTSRRVSSQSTKRNKRPTAATEARDDCPCELRIVTQEEEAAYLQEQSSSNALRAQQAPTGIFQYITDGMRSIFQLLSDHQ